MKNLFLILLSILFLSSYQQETSFEYNSSNFKLVKLSNGVYACIHKIGGKAISNAGIIDNGDETIIFDTFLSPEAAEELLQAVKKLDLSPVKYVINSHAHNDHIRGNQVFNEDVDIISTSKTAELIKEWEPEQIEYEKEFAQAQFDYYDSLLAVYQGDSTDTEFTKIQMWRPYYEVLSKSHLEVMTRIPNLFFKEEKSLNGPDREVQLISKGKGHTESDLILYLPDDKIVFAGDLVFTKCHPYLGDGFPHELKNWLDFINSLHISTVIPGHGEIGGLVDVSRMKNYLTDLENIVKKLVSENIKFNELEKVEIPPDYKDWLFDRFFLYNLKFIYNQVKENQ